MARQRMKPVRRRPEQQPAGNRPPTPPRGPAARHKPAWREAIDSFGGFLTLGALAFALVVVVAIIIVNRPNSGAGDASDASLRGEARDTGEASHTTDPRLLVILPGEPPTGGPHFAVPQSVGIYDQQVPDGAAIHSLEHGMVWISYNPGKINDATKRQLRDLGNKYDDDVVVSPRPENAMAIAAASWGRLLKLDAFDKGQLEAFIETNRNRSPEPGVR